MNTQETDQEKRRRISMNLRVDKTLHDEFIEAVRAQDRSGSQVIRDFMRNYVQKQPAPKAGV